MSRTLGHKSSWLIFPPVSSCHFIYLSFLHWLLKTYLYITIFLFCSLVSHTKNFLEQSCVEIYTWSLVGFENKRTTKSDINETRTQTCSKGRTTAWGARHLYSSPEWVNKCTAVTLKGLSHRPWTSFTKGENGKAYFCHRPDPYQI